MKAIAISSSYTTLAGLVPAIIEQKMQSGMAEKTEIRNQILPFPLVGEGCVSRITQRRQHVAEQGLQGGEVRDAGGAEHEVIDAEVDEGAHLVDDLLGRAHDAVGVEWFPFHQLVERF